MAGVQRRAKARTSTQPTARYDAGGMGRRIARWNPPATGPQKALQGFERMRSRVHDAVRNDWAAESSAQKWVTNLIGTGIQPRFKSAKHRKIWDQFGRQSDADGVLDIYGQQVLMGRALFDGGEVFLRRRPRDLTSPLDVPVQIQLIESEYCPMFDADVWPGLPVGNKINQGIERNRFGARVAFWFYKEHPGDSAGQPGNGDLIRVASSQVAHIYEVKRPGQLRGVSPLSSILLRLRSIGDFEDAGLERQKLANLFTVFVTNPVRDDLEEDDYDELTGLPKTFSTDGIQMTGLEPGIAQTLKPGQDIKFASPPSAGVGYAEYLRSGHLGTAAGQGLPYELMSGDIKDVSDRTLRVIINEFRRYCQQRQWVTLIPMGCQKMVDWCMDAAALAGVLPLSQLAEAKAPTWTPQGWEYIHPTQDAQGKKLLLGMGVISKTSIIVERGDEPAKVFEERESDSEEEERRGIKMAADGTLLDDAVEPADPLDPEADDPVTPAPAKRKPAAQAPQITVQAAAPNNQALEATLSGLMLLVNNMQTQNAAMVGAMNALAEQLVNRPMNVAVAAPTVTIEQAVTHVAVAAPNVTVEPAITNVAVAAPVVHVEPAAVQVTNNVPPAEVTVNLPDRHTTSEIQRDLAGNIVNVTQTETTLQ